jgi:hypothetical protein
MIDAILPPVLRTALLAGMIGVLTLAVGEKVDAWLTESTLRIPIVLGIGWFGITCAWLIPLTIRIYEVMEDDNATEK